jgi:hypothetical protein
MLDRAILKLMKTFLDVLEMHPWSLLHCGVLTALLDFLCNQIIIGADPALYHSEAFHRKSMLFINSVLKNPAYKGSPSKSFEVGFAARHQVRH